MDSSDPDILTEGLNLDIQNELQESNKVDLDVAQQCQGLEAYSSEKTQEAMESESDSQCPNASSIDNSGVESNAGKCQTPQVYLMNKYEMDSDGERESQSPTSPSVDLLEARASVKDEEDTFVVPAVGMEFESEEHAYKSYSKYAVLEGFSIRKDFVNKSRVNGAVVSRRYTCHRQGYRSDKHNVNVLKPRKETRTGCLAHMTIVRQPSGKFRVSHFEAKHNHEFVNPSTAHLLPSQKRLKFAEAVDADLTSYSGMDGVPKFGMGFESEDHAYEFYNTYAGQVGFSVRKDYVNKSKIDGAVVSRRFTCFREGFRQKDKRDMNVKRRPRKETRVGCLAQLVISRQSDGQYRVTHFEERHNHELVAACRVQMLRSQKRLAVAQNVEGNAIEIYKIKARSACEVSCNSIGDCVDHGHDPIDHRSKLSIKRTREMRQGEAERIQQYFRSKKIKNPSFFYAIQLDVENQITNIFWADAKMIMDYSDFGDVLCFDTTFRLNKDCHLFSSFLGVNHHKQMAIFGAALLYDETVDSLKWLFQKFLEAMSGKKPKTILTDQDANVSEAAKAVFPEVHKRMCVWHVYQSALKQLGHIFVGPSFVNDLRSCFFNHVEEEDFIAAWKLMLDKHGLWENEWLSKIFAIREQWAIAYRKHIFCADIYSLQLHESFIVNLKKYLKPESNVLSFFKHLAKVVNDWHYKELEANYNMSQNTPRLMGDVILLKHARDVYTPRIFELFQHEYETCLNIIINQCIEGESNFEYKVSTYGQPREYAVSYNLVDNTVFCSCMKFEFMGVLCSHALKVLDYRNIRLLPSQYILKRWTRDARV